jgi:GT2 family glycosyltransferase
MRADTGEGSFDRTGTAVAVVLLNYCGEEDTVECVRSLGEPSRSRLAVILVDNGSPDGSGDRLHRRFPEIEYVQTGANLGYTGGNNAGIARALEMGCDYVLVLNNDTLVEPGAIDRLVETAESEKGVGAVGPKIVYAEDPDRAWFAGGVLDRIRAVGRHSTDDAGVPAGGTGARDVSFLTGCCILLPVHVIRRIGGFEESYFMYLEDAEFSVRLSVAGFRLIYEPRARIHHRVSLEAKPPAPYQIEYRDRNRRRLARRHFTRLERAAFAAFFYPTRLAYIAAYMARGDADRARAIWRGMTAE